MDINVNFSFHIPTSYIIITLLIIVVIADLALAWRTWISNRKNPVNIFYALAVLTAALWTIIHLMREWIITDPQWISISFRLGYFLAVFIAVFFYFFTYYFPYRTTTLSKRAVIFFLSISSGVMFISLLPNVLVAARVYPEDVDKQRYSLFWCIVYTTYFIGTIIFSYRNLVSKYESAVGIWKARLKQIIIASGTAFFGGILFTLILPVYFRVYQLYWIGFLFSLFMTAYIWYHIFWIPNRKVKSKDFYGCGY